MNMTILRLAYKLPDTCMLNADEYMYFRDFALSDLQIEVNHAIKDKVATDQLERAYQRRKYRVWSRHSC